MLNMDSYYGVYASWQVSMLLFVIGVLFQSFSLFILFYIGYVSVKLKKKPEMYSSGSA